MKNTWDEMEEAKERIKQADHILIGAGSGLSTSAGIDYFGERFRRYFSDFIEIYHFTDMYTSSFYEFATEEERWAYWARHINTNYTSRQASSVYQDLLKIIEKKDYFVITTNVDGQFQKAGFPRENVFEVQGCYGNLQCKEACHDELYENENSIKEMIAQTINCKIPTKLVPKCPKCAGKMEVNIRKDAFFVQDKNWYQQNQRYESWIEKNKEEKTILLEMGVGFNTPGIIRFPFEQMVEQNENWFLIRVNSQHPETILPIEEKVISIQKDSKQVIEEVKKN